MEHAETPPRGQGSAPHAPAPPALCLELPSGDTVPVRVTRVNQAEIELRCAEITFLVSVINQRGNVETCVDDLKSWLLDAIASKLVVRDRADLIFVHPASTGGVWLCSVGKDSREWRCLAINIDRPMNVSTDYALPGTDDQLQNLIEIHQALVSFAGPVLFRETRQENSTLLRVKVHPEEHWFARFPLGVFAKFHFAGFESYVACQWIVTERTISQIAANQTKTECEIADTKSFLEGTYILINTYQRHANTGDAPFIENGFDLLMQLLGQLQSITLDNHLFSLRWTMNPTRDQLNSIILSESTKFLFADFEAAGGFWSLGDGQHRCHTTCNHHLSGSDLGEFDLHSLRGRLAHIRLMRVFHCNSLYDPYRPNRQPADDGTIAAALLATNAFFVECSPTAEPIIDFICVMLGLLLGRADLRTILFAKSLSNGYDFSNLVSRANGLLQRRGFTKIAEFGP